MFTDETAACMLVGEHAFVMLLTRERFAEFAKLPIADPTTHTLALYCFSVSSRDEVDTVSAAALAAGGSEAGDAEDYGFIYSRSFFDLDGHRWQGMWVGPGGGGGGPQGVAAGGSEADDAEDYGFMYSRSFFDLDGHGWQVMWMDPEAAERGPEAFAASMQDADAPA